MLKLVNGTNKKYLMIFVILILFFSIMNISTIANGESRPDLVIDYYDPPNDDEIIEGKNLEFVVKIKNQGEKNISDGTKIGVALIIDYLIVATNSTWNGLPADSLKYINLSWTPTFDDIGQHLLSIEVDYEEIIIESDENNNFLDSNIKVLERITDLEIIGIDPQDALVVNQTVRIYSTIKNNGKSSTNPIYAKLNSSEDGEVDTIVKEDSLPRGETHNFSFNWIPSHFGSQTITIDVIYNGKTHDLKEKSVVVEIDPLQWWNESWHYRYFLTVNGSGNVSKFFNFTKILSEIGVSSQSFENETIRIIEYLNNGSWVSEILNYKFIESVGFDNVSNATGTLIWNVTVSSEEKYYCIYFDVASNLGYRTELLEIENITESGDAIIGYYCFVDGWWIEVVEPINGSYCLIDQTVNITVNTIAMADNVIVEFFYWNNSKINTTWLANVDNNVSWIGNYTFTIEGNWKIKINSNDGAEYEPAIVEHDFYVGKTDVEIINITFTTDWPPTSPIIYKNDTVNITACLVANNATIDNVNVSLSIENIENKQVVFTQTTNTTIFIDKNNLISFSWKANKSGDFNVSITLDPDDLIDEQNESNNKIFETIIVLDWPDLAIDNIILPIKEITELDPVIIEVVIANKGDCDATNYEVRLYLEKATQGIMIYSFKIDSKLVSIKKNISMVVDMHWDSARPGEWLVGAKVIVNDTKRDTNNENNRFLLNKTLIVKSIERNKPVIKIVGFEPSRPEQGEPVTITAKITDDSGLESVIIIITDPLNFLYNRTMLRTAGHIFKFIFDNTLLIGTYDFQIEAIDISLHSNTATNKSNFTIYEDATPPVISYFDARPRVQLTGGNVNFTCIVTDNIGIEIVRVIITPAEGVTFEKTMNWSPEGKYVYSNIYETIGKYIYYIKAEDKAGKIDVTTYETFWITSDLDDTDNDGMPDCWEEKYNFDPEDPTDAVDDFDGDGLTNLKECEAGTNPIKDVFIENAIFRIKDNTWYLVGSIAIFLLILILPIFDKRRKSK